LVPNETRLGASKDIRFRFEDISRLNTLLVLMVMLLQPLMLILPAFSKPISTVVSSYPVTLTLGVAVPFKYSEAPGELNLKDISNARERLGKLNEARLWLSRKIKLTDCKEVVPVHDRRAGRSKAIVSPT